MPPEYNPNGLVLSQLSRTGVGVSTEDALDSLVGVTEDEYMFNSNDTAVTDGLAVYRSEFPVDLGEGESFTLSASFSFTTNIRAATLFKGESHLRSTQQPMHTEGRSKRPRASSDSHIDEDKTTSFAFNGSGSLYSLPHRHVVTALLDQFFLTVYPATPYVLEGETREQCDLLWAPGGRLNPLSLAHINMIFALTCQFSQGRPDRDPLLGDSKAAGEAFHRQARRYITANPTRRTSVPMLQLFLLEINYYQGIGQADKCWLTIGIAVRIAQALGLHQKLPHNTTVSPMRQGLYKRLWWGCYYLDR